MTAADTTARPARAARARAATTVLDTVDTSIEQACRMLQLPTIRACYEDVAVTALRDHASYKQFLADLLNSELAERAQRRRLRLVREAAFPRPNAWRTSTSPPTLWCHPKSSTPWPNQDG